MKIVISPHAKRRMDERGILDIDIYLTLLQPEVVGQDKTNEDRFVAKRIYKAKKREGRFLLLVVYELHGDQLYVITVISTSKINKYL